jgi:drug/metabolite transporter (DMT)-like permease
VKKELGLFAVIAAIGANFLWGSTFMASKVVLSQCPPVTATFIRFAIAVIVFGIIALLRENNFQFSTVKARIGELLCLGLFGISGLYILQMTALKHITSSQSAAIMLLAPVFTLITESVLKKELRLREALITLVGLVGASAILFDQYRVDFTGVAFQGLLLTVGASLFLGVSVVQTKRLLAVSKRGSGFTVFNVTFYSLLIGLLGLIPFLIVEQTHSVQGIPLTPAFWVWSAYLGILCSVVAFLAWNWSIKHVSPVGVAVAMYLKTPVALGIGAVLLHENLTFIFYAGTLLIIATLFSNQLVLARGNR